MKERAMVEERREFFTDTALTNDEQQRLAVYEAAIEASFTSQTAGGLAAEQIRTERLWRGQWESFAHYCEDRWQVTQDAMNRRIRAAHVVKAIEDFSLQGMPENGGIEDRRLPNRNQALELGKLKEPEEQREVWEEVLAGVEPVTAKTVQEAVKQRREAKGSAAVSALRDRAFALALALPAERDAARSMVSMQGMPPD